MAHAYLFVGPSGVGKRQAARAFSAVVQARLNAGDDVVRERQMRLALEDTRYDSVLAEGWDESTWPVGDGPLTGADLDTLGTRRPVVARRACTHIAVANRAARSRSVSSVFRRSAIRPARAYIPNR